MADKIKTISDFTMNCKACQGLMFLWRKGNDIAGMADLYKCKQCVEYTRYIFPNGI
jgi:predicted SprT family Zn-dependent metalloprotease